MKVYLIRHGKTNDDHNGMTQHDGSHLLMDQETKEKAKKVKKVIKNVDRVYSSPLKRAVQTTELLTDNFTVMDMLREYRQPKCLETLTHEERAEWWRKHPESKTDPDWCFDGSESFNDLKRRAYLLERRLLGYKVRRRKSIALVTHSTFAKHLLLFRVKPDYNQKDFYETVYPMKIDNLQVVEIDI